MTTAVHPRPYVTVAEAAEQLGVSEATVRRAVRDGALPVVQLRGSRGAVRIPAAALEPKETT